LTIITLLRENAPSLNFHGKNILSGSLQALFEYIDSFSGKRILVVGDLILDEFIWGSVRRISPEAPVPVVEVEKESTRLGGSANVVNNLIAMGCKASICGIIGDDVNGERLKALLWEMGVDCAGVVVKDNRPTAIKTRVIARHQQIVRFDRESPAPPSESTLNKIIGDIGKVLSGIDALIISDYGKGMVSERLLAGVIPQAAAAAVPIAVDPKPVNFPFYRGVTVITPNHFEAAEAAGVDTESEEGILEAGAILLRRRQAEAILITRGENGMSLFERGKKTTHIPTVARDVYDVTGAGDTVIATMALSLASGASPKEAALLANYAAGIVVGKMGTATASIKELKAAMKEREEGR